MLHTNMFVKQLYLLHYISELPYQYIESGKNNPTRPCPEFDSCENKVELF